MARPRKTNSATYRPPTFSATDNRWRFRIEHHPGTKEFRWPNEDSTMTCPPQIIAASVAAQDHFRAIVLNWETIGFYMKHAEPTRDWTRPVWLTNEQIEAAKQGVENARTANRRSHEIETAQIAALIGIDRRAGVLSELQPGSPSYPGGPWEQDRLQLLTQLRPSIERKKVVTVREALTKYLAGEEARTLLKVSNRIERSTYLSTRTDLLSGLGLSTSPQQQQIRTTPIKLDEPLPDRETIEEFARFWHSLPEGIASERTVRNYLRSIRALFKWCEDRFEFRFRMTSQSC